MQLLRFCLLLVLALGGCAGPEPVRHAPMPAAQTPPVADDPGRIIDLNDPAQLYAQWPEATQAVGASIRLPATETFAWPGDRGQRHVVMDKAGVGGSLFTRGDFGGPIGHVGLGVIFSGGPERTMGTPTMAYLGGDGPGQCAPGRVLRLNNILFWRASSETGVAGAHRLVLQQDVELVYQAATAFWNPPHLRVYGGYDLDIRELALNGQRLAFYGGSLNVPLNGYVISYAGIDFGGGVLEFHDAVYNNEVVRGAGFGDDSYLSLPAPTGPTKEPANLYLRGRGTLRWQTLTQQCLSPLQPTTHGVMGTLSRWDTTGLTIEIGNNRYRQGVSDWEVWSDGRRLKVGTIRIGGDYPATIRLQDRRPSLLEEGGEVLLVGTLEIAANGRLDCNGIPVVCDSLILAGKSVKAGIYKADQLGDQIVDAAGRAEIRVGKIPVGPDPNAVATARIRLRRPGRVSVGIFDPAGRLVRNLLFGELRDRGDLWVEWDGLDEMGRPMPPGRYEWRALTRPGFRATLVANLGTSHPEGVRRCWMGNHTGPETVAVDEKGYYIASAGSEFTGQLVAIRPDGTRRWSFTWKDEHGFGPEVIASDGAGRLAIVQYTHGQDDHLYLSVAETENGAVRGRYKLSLLPEVPQWGRRNKLDIAARHGVALITDKVNNRLAWFSLLDGTEQASVNLDGPGSVTVDDKGRWWILAKEGVFSCQTGQAPQRMWPQLTLAQPRAMAWDGAAGNFLVLEGGSEQVLRVSPEGNVIARFGRAGGRQPGPWEGEDFKGLHDVAPDGRGGFVTVELGQIGAHASHGPGGRPAVNRTAHFDAAGRLTHEWFGGARWSHNIALDPDDPTLATIEGGPGMLCLVRIHAATQSWKMLETFDEPDTGRLLKPFGQPGWHLKRRGGKLWFFHADPTAGISVYEIDRAGKRLVPRATTGLMAYFPAERRPEVLAAALEAQPPEIQRISVYHLGFHWSDDNNNGQIEAAEFVFFTWPFSYGWQIDVGDDWRLTGPSQTREHPWLSLPNLRAAEPAAAPRWDFAAPQPAVATYPEPCRDEELFPGITTVSTYRDKAGNTYQLVLGNGAVNEDRQGEFWPEGYGGITRIAKWDAAGNPQWAVGRHIGGVGRYTMAYGLLGVAHGCIVTRDRYGQRNLNTGQPAEATLLWSEDGLYAGNLMETLVGFDDAPWVQYWNDHADSAVEYDQHFNGLWTYPDGSVYYAMQGRSATPLFKIDGWENWERQKGQIKLTKAPAAAAGKGTGLRGAYFANPDWQGQPALVRNDARIWFEMDPKLTGGLIPAHWGEGAPAEGLPADNFSVRWTGELEPRFSESYRFIVESDVNSQVRVWLGDRLIIEDDGTTNRGASRFGGGFDCRRSHSVPIRLQAGQRVPLRIEYRHAKGQAGIHLMWESRTQDRQHVPTRFLYPAQTDLGQPPR